MTTIAFRCACARTRCSVETDVDALTRCLAQIPDRSTALIDRDIRETLEAFASDAARRQIKIERWRWPDEGGALLPALRAAA